jgi:hypothetical protein
MPRLSSRARRFDGKRGRREGEGDRGVEFRCGAVSTVDHGEPDVRHGVKAVHGGTDVLDG